MNSITPAQIAPSIRVCNYIHPDNGEMWGPRTIPDYELILVVAGIFKYISQEKSITVKSGQILLIKPMIKHSLRHINEFGKGTISCIHCDATKTSEDKNLECQLIPAPETITTPKEFEIFHESFKQCCEIFDNFAPYKKELLETIVKSIWIRLAQYWQKKTSQSISPRIQEMTEYLRETMKTNVSRHDLADKFGYSPEHINYLFKKELGITPTEFINHQRVLLAFHLIKNDQLSVKEASHKTGFNDQYYFSRVFKKIMGYPPAHFKSE